MERNLTDAFKVGSIYRFQFDGTFATNFVEVIDIIPPCWVYVKEDPEREYDFGELVNLNNVARVFGRNFKKAVEDNE
jgi:hypothetical protein